MTTTHNFTLASQFNRPTQMKRVISLSPLARIFQPYCNIEPFIEDHTLIYNHEYNEKNPFKIVIQGSWATQQFDTKQIHLIDESLSLVYVGIDNTRFNKEFGGSGLVYFDVPDKIAIALEYASKTGYDLPPEIRKELDTHLDNFRQLSHRRVLEHCKNLYNTIKAGRQAVREAGKQPHEPNDMEMLLATILAEEIQKAKSRRSKLRDAWEAAEGKIGEDADKLF